MSEKDLRAKVIRLAHSNPSLREHLLPLVQKTSSPAVYFDTGQKTLNKTVVRKMQELYPNTMIYKAHFVAKVYVLIAVDRDTREVKAETMKGYGRNGSFEIHKQQTKKTYRENSGELIAR